MAKATRAYITSDGHLVRDKKTADKHEAWLELIELTGAFAVDLEIVSAAGQPSEEQAHALAIDLVEYTVDLQRLLKIGPVKCNGPTVPDETQPEDDND